MSLNPQYLTLIFAVVSLLATAQTYHVKSYTSLDGLISNQVNGVVQDESGLLWVSTIKGITRFDGISWNDLTDSVNVPIGPNTRLKLLPTNEVLIAGHASNYEFSVKIYSKDSSRQINLPFNFGYDSRKYWDVSGSVDNLFFNLIVPDTLYSYSFEKETWTSRSLPANLSGQIIRLRSCDEQLYLLTKVGLYKISDGEFLLLAKAPKDTSQGINDIVEFNSTLYAVGHNWLGRVEKNEIQILTTFPERDPKANELTVSSNGFLFFRTDSKYHWYHIASGDQIDFTADSDDAIPQNSRLYIDQEDNLWITSYRGLHKISGFLFLSFTANSGLLEYEVSAVTEFAPKKFFVGSPRSYAIIENGQIRSFNFLIPERSLKKMRVLNAISKGSGKESTVYICAQELGIGELQSDYSLKWYAHPNALSVEMIKIVNDTIWTTSKNGELYFFQDGKFNYYTSLHCYPRNIYSLEDGTKLICSSNGLRILKGKKVEVVPVANDILLKSTYCMFEHNGIRYLGTEAGLATWTDEGVNLASLNGRTISNPIYAVLKISDDEYWFGTDKGVIIIRGSKKILYGDSDGIVGPEINRGAFIQAKDGSILIGTNHGLNFYDPKMNFNQPQIFNPEILSLETTEVVPHPWRELRLPASNKNLKINVRSITFTEQPVLFRYRMNKFESNWSVLSSEDQRQIQYRNLPPGQYQFEIQSRLGTGPWSASVVSAPIEIEQSFYASFWFYLIILSLAAGLGFVINRVATQFVINRKLKEVIQSKVREIELNEAKLQLALENSRMGVWTYNFETKRVDHTSQIFDMLNIRPRELSSEEYSSFVHPKDFPELLNVLQESVEKRIPFDFEMRLKVSENNYRWMQIKGKCIYAEDGSPQMLSGTIIDINERKQYEADREKLITELEQTNRELDRFVYSASHDLSAPMKSVMGLINLARMNPSPVEMQNYLSLIDRSIRKQDEFIKEIIAFARNTRTEVQMEPIDFKEIVDETLSNLKYTDQYLKSDFRIEVQPGCENIPGDRTRLKIILNNLISNAIKFQRNNSTKHFVKILATRNNGTLNIVIEDNGEGIKPEHTSRIFEMFYRATDNAPGSGLGLYIAKEAAEKMGCEISVESEYGTGSSFKLTFHSNGINSSSVI